MIHYQNVIHPSLASQHVHWRSTIRVDIVKVHCYIIDKWRIDLDEHMYICTYVAGSTDVTTDCRTFWPHRASSTDKKMCTTSSD